MRALGRDVELETFDGNQPVVLGIERAKHGTECTGPDLVEHAKRTEGVGRWTSCFRVQ